MARPVVILEDNVLIAIDIEQMVARCGADTIFSAQTLEEAARFAHACPEAVFLFDILIGSETSIPLARALVALGRDVAFLTGMGDISPIPEDLNHLVVISKPIDENALIALLKGFLVFDP